MFICKLATMVSSTVSLMTLLPSLPLNKFLSRLKFVGRHAAIDEGVGMKFMRSTCPYNLSLGNKTKFMAARRIEQRSTRRRRWRRFVMSERKKGPQRSRSLARPKSCTSSHPSAQITDGAERSLSSLSLTDWAKRGGQ